MSSHFSDLSSTGTTSALSVWKPSVCTLTNSSPDLSSISTTDQPHDGELWSHSPQPIDQEENKMDLSVKIDVEFSIPDELNLSSSSSTRSSNFSDLSSTVTISTPTTTNHSFRTSTLTHSSFGLSSISTSLHLYDDELWSNLPQSIDQEENKMDSSVQIPEGVMCQYDLEMMGLQRWNSWNSYPSISTNRLSCGSLHQGSKKSVISLPVPFIHQEQEDNTPNLNEPGVHQNGGSKYESMYSKKRHWSYKMDSDPRGLVLILNNVNFQNFDPRIGSDKDQEKIRLMFEYLGFKISEKNDLTAQEIRQCLEEFAEREELKSVSALAVVILTHGAKNDCLFGIDGLHQDGSPVPGTYINKIDLSQYFTRRNCPSMAGKPKLFILQACRGDFEDELPNENRSEFNLDCYADSPDKKDGFQQKTETIRDRRADTSDMCFVYSSSSEKKGFSWTNKITNEELDREKKERFSQSKANVLIMAVCLHRHIFRHNVNMSPLINATGYKAYRGRSDGSPFMSLFTKHMQRYAHRKEFMDIIRKVQRHFTRNELANYMMTMPDCSTQLIKKWYLNPPHDARSPMGIAGCSWTSSNPKPSAEEDEAPTEDPSLELFLHIC